MKGFRVNLLRDTLQISSRAHISYPIPLIAAPGKCKPSTLNRLSLLQRYLVFLTGMNRSG